MTVYAALLRAVNVGGTGKLPMAELVGMCQRAGFRDVRTYIASGNAVFSSSLDETGVRGSLAKSLHAYAGKPVGVLVRTAAIVNYMVSATLYTFAGPDSQVVLAEARTRLDRYIAESHRLGRDVTRSGLFAALHAEGVQRVEIASPAADVVVDRTQATYCTAVTLTHGGNDE